MKLIMTLLLALTVASVAAASDAKTYAGAMCRANGTPSTDNFSTVTSTWYTNSDTSSHTVTCPVVRDTNSASYIMAGIVHGTGTDWTNSSCTLRVTGTDGSSIYVEASDSIYVAGNTSQIEWTYVSCGGCANYGAYAFRCSVPAGASITRFYIEEF
jgi:hypothetical protein